MSVDTSAAASPSAIAASMTAADDLDDDLRPVGSATASIVPAKKKSLKDKIKAAKESVRGDEERSKEKLAGRTKSRALDKSKTGGVVGILGGADYLKLHDKRPGGIKRRFR